MNTALTTTDQNQAIVPADVSAGALQAALAGDLARLPEADRLKFYGRLCEFTGLNPLSKPFDWITFQGKLTLYANKGCAEQLRKIHKVNVEIIERRHEFGVYWVRVKVTDGDGRSDEALAALPLPDNAPADARAMAMMKCETKAKRRGTFSICGLSLMVRRDDDDGEDRKPSIAATSTVTDKAAELNAEIIEVTANDPRNELLGQIQGIIKSLVPGTDTESKRVKADWLQKAFGVRSWTVIEALPADKLKEGFEKLTALMVAPSEPEPVAPVVATVVEEPPFDALPVESNTLPEDIVEKLEAVVSDYKTTALAWLVKQKWITDEQGLRHLPLDKAQKIIASPNQFQRAVNPVTK